MGIAPTIGGRGGNDDRTQLACTAAGILSESISPLYATTFTSPSSQTAYGSLVGLRAGDKVTGVVLRSAVAAAGTNPATVRAGLADATGKIVAVSGNYGSGGTNNATTVFAAGANPIPFSSPFTVVTTGGYYVCLLVNGTWGTTQPTLANAGVQGAAMLALGTGAPPLFSQSAQADLPAVGSALTISGNASRSFYLAAY